MNHAWPRSASLSKTALLGLASATLTGLGACGGGGSGSGSDTASLETASIAVREQAEAAINPATTYYRISPLSIPSETGLVERNNLNESNQVAGVYGTREGWRGFFHDGSTLTTLTPPKPSETGQWALNLFRITGLNSSGQIIGGYDYEQMDNPPETAPRMGQVAFAWTRTRGFVSLTSATSSESLANNDAGQVGGRLSIPDEPFNTKGFLWSASGGLKTSFGPGTELAEATSINASGMMAGHGTYQGQFGALLVNPNANSTTLLVRAQDFAQAIDINDAGAVAGHTLRTDDDRFHAFFAHPSAGSAAVDLGDLIGTPNFSFVQDMNNRGEVVMQTHIFNRPSTRSGGGFYWSRPNGMLEIKPPAQVHTTPVAINNQGLVVGFHDEWRGEEYVGIRAFAWTKESGLVDLTSRVKDAPPGFHLHAAQAVNDKGTIVASSTSGLVLLTPVSQETFPQEGGPVISALLAKPFSEAGRRVSFRAIFTDADLRDTHTATWSWGDGSPPETAAVKGRSLVGLVRGDHVFNMPGNYLVRLRITDRAGRSAEISREVVVHERSTGWVAGTGVILSPAGAHRADPAGPGQALFSLSARYKKSPTARKEPAQAFFSFQNGQVIFRSRTFTTLSLDGSSLLAEGQGSLNGQAGHRFQLTGQDRSNDRTGRIGGDRLRLKIWRRSQGAEVLVYDNASGSRVIGGDLLVRPQ